MPAITQPPAPHWVPAPATSADLDWAELQTIDLHKARTPEERAEQVRIAADAMHNQGFFYVVNHGLEQPQIERMFDIASVPFVSVEPEEKKVYEAKIKETGTFMGYKPLQYWHIANGVKDRLEHYNINREVNLKQHPSALRPFLPEIQDFIRFNHEGVIHELTKLLALGLELPEDTLSNVHSFNEKNHSYARFILYHPRPAEEEVQTENVWLKGHADHTSLSLLWSQPVAALQIRDAEGKWRYVKHKENALIVNCGDTLDMLSGGYYKSAIHRVVQPPEDQQGYKRLGVIYFCYADDDLPLAPFMSSPVLQNFDVVRRAPEGQEPSMATWRKARTAAYGTSELKKSTEKGVEEEVVAGIRVKHFN
ncbi:Clavaminate synthase-like protein [Dentipellis sp. KUC8613]|nr:Clavaminate synthase-like protein [Dentipellis sp. KUC8613]